MLLVQDATLLLLDEPVAGMSARGDATQTGELLRRIAERPHGRRRRARHGLHALVRRTR